MTQLINFTKVNFDNFYMNAVSARDLHEFLESKRKFTDWIKLYVANENDYGFIENVDFVKIDGLVNANNVEIIDYAFSIEMAKEVSMLQKNDKGRQARKYFINCEKQLNNLQLKNTEYLNNLLILVKELCVKEDIERISMTKTQIDKRMDAARVNLYKDPVTGFVTEYVTIKETAKFLGYYNADNELDPKNKHYYSNTMNWLAAAHELRGSLMDQADELPREVMIPYKNGEPYLALTLHGFNQVIEISRFNRYKDEGNRITYQLETILSPLKTIVSNFHNFQKLTTEQSINLTQINTENTCTFEENEL